MHDDFTRVLTVKIYVDKLETLTRLILFLFIKDVVNPNLLPLK